MRSVLGLKMGIISAELWSLIDFQNCTFKIKKKEPNFHIHHLFILHQGH